MEWTQQPPASLSAATEALLIGRIDRLMRLDMEREGIESKW